MGINAYPSREDLKKSKVFYEGIREIVVEQRAAMVEQGQGNSSPRIDRMDAEATKIAMEANVAILFTQPGPETNQ